MRLLNIHSLEFAEYHHDEDRPRYVIASHRWVGHSEATFKDIQEKHNTNSEGYKKVKAFAQYVKENVPSVEWLWIDTCCINKDSAAELSEAINLMFKWYRNAELCVAYLRDVEGVEDRSSFKNSEWFKRGWTLQELLAPRTVIFVTKTWQVIGNKGASFNGYSKVFTGPGLERDVATVTGIPERVLHDFATSLGLSVDERLEWMQGRRATREEDMSYALYGIFGVTPGANYGEEHKGARRRLLVAIRQQEEAAVQTERSATLPEPSSTVPFCRDPDFVERPALLEQLHTKLSIPGARSALVGLGGAGKTQLAAEYARRTRELSPRTWILWLHASTAARLEQSIRNIAEQANIYGRHDAKANIFQLFYTWLCNKRNGEWLLVLDNVDDASFLLAPPSTTEEKKRLIDYLPACEHGSILITTRSRREAFRVVHESQMILVTPMEDKLAEALLEKKLGSEECGDLSKLAVALDFMPLAMAQAAAYIRERSPRCSVAQYLEELERSSGSRTGLLQRDTRFPDRDHEASGSILITWQISFEHISRTRQSAADLLSLMSFCDRQAIPENLARENNSSLEQAYPYFTTDDGFEEDVAMLRSYSFISVTADCASWEMHRLVQDATRMWLEDRGRFQAVYERFVHRLDRVFPSGNYENWQMCQMLFPHVLRAADQKPWRAEALLDWASVMYKAACYALDKGQWVQAKKMAIDSMHERASALGKDNTETLYSTALVGSVLRTCGRWKEAEKLDVEVMEMRKVKLGADHPDTLTSMDNLASTYWGQGRWAEAEKLDVKVVETSKVKLGADHPDTLTSMANLASTYREQGRWAEAEKLEVEVMETSTAKLGADHPDTINSMANLGVTYSIQGKEDKAEVLKLKVMETRNAKLGADHPDTLISMANLAVTYLNQGRQAEAEKLNVEVVETRKTKLGPDHPSTLISIANLASTYWDQGRREEAEQLQIQAVKGMIQVFGTEHPRTLSSIATLERMRCHGDELASSQNSLDLREVVPRTRTDEFALPISIRSVRARGQGSIQKSKKWWQALRKKVL